jgi:hypothetical protein
MQHAEVHDDGVEGARVERQRFRIAFAELNARMQTTGRGDHRARKIESHHLCSAAGGNTGDEPGSTGDLEQTSTGMHPCGVEQGIRCFLG